MSAIDRLSSGYEPSFDIDYEVGRQGELFVADIVDAVRDGGSRIEIKTDAMVTKTGNLYIEQECLRRGRYVASGITDTTAELWAFVLPANVLIVAPTANVRELAARFSPRECKRGSHPTKGVTVPVGYFVQELYRYVA